MISQLAKIKLAPISVDRIYNSIIINFRSKSALSIIQIVAN